MLIIGRGDPHVRASHSKTLELSVDAAITERATCVVGVDARSVGPVMAGPVTVTVRTAAAAGDHAADDHAADEVVSFPAEANSGWDRNGAAVIRRSALALPGTLATHAGVAAADLPRELVERLRDPSVEVRVELSARVGPPTVVLFAVGAGCLGAQPEHQLTGQRTQLAAELVAADAVLAQDAAARREIAAAVHDAGLPQPTLIDRPSEIAAPDTAAPRVLVVACAAPPTLGAATLGRVVRTVGLTPEVAAAVVAPWPGPTTYAEPVTQARWWRSAQQLLRSTPRSHRVVIDAARDDVARLLAAAVSLRGCAHAVVTRDHAPPQLIRLAPPDGSAPAGLDEPAVTSVDLSGSRRVVVCFAPASQGPVDAVVRAAIDGLRADGVGARPAARALAVLTGMTRRAAYETVLSWDRDSNRQ